MFYVPTAMPLLALASAPLASVSLSKNEGVGVMVLNTFPSSAISDTGSNPICSVQMLAWKSQVRRKMANSIGIELHLRSLYSFQ